MPRDRPTVVMGVGVAGRAVARALSRRGHPVVLADDAPGPAARELALTLDSPLLEAPDPAALATTLAGAGAMVPAPGLDERHPAFAAAAGAGVPVVGELDLAAAWDDRPTLAVTGTDGKTTVTTLVAAMLEESGIAAAEAGNTDVPLVEAIDDPEPEVFVVEASSFRLAPLRRFAPRAGCWLNFGPDHQDVHRDLAAYETAKAAIWRDFGPDQLAVVNRDDGVVAAHAVGLPCVETFGLGPAPEGPGHWSVDDGELRTPEGDVLLDIGDLHRGLPHDVANALAAAATARAGGATPDATARALRAFRGLPHRVQLVGWRNDVAWYDDSKATAPHATLAAVAGFASVVLVAGGRNKGLDLSMLRAAAAHVRSVVAIGEAAEEVAAAFADVRPVVVVTSDMDEAVAVAAGLARAGDTVLLSPACASFDWYRSYGERGDDFTRAALALGVEPVSTGHPEVAP